MLAESLEVLVVGLFGGVMRAARIFVIDKYYKKEGTAEGQWGEAVGFLFFVWCVHERGPILLAAAVGVAGFAVGLWLCSLFKAAVRDVVQEMRK